MKKRQESILSIIQGKRIATQQELAEELARRGIEATQSSVSRDISKLGLTKVNGHYAAPTAIAPTTVPIIVIAPAGDNLIVVKTDTGQAQPAALVIDRANIDEVVGTVAGDDTILVAVKNAAAQRVAIKKINSLFDHSFRAGRKSSKMSRGEKSRGEQSRAGFETSWRW